MQEIQEIRVRSLSGADPLEEEMAVHSSILAWEIPWTEKPGGLQSTGSQRAGHDLATEHTCHYLNKATAAKIRQMCSRSRLKEMCKNCHSCGPGYTEIGEETPIVSEHKVRK